MADARDSALRRTRSAGDVPVSSSTIRSPDPAHLRNSESYVRGAAPPSDALVPPTMARSRNSAGLVLDRAHTAAIPEASEHSIDIPPLLIPNPTPQTPPALPPPPLARYNASIYSRLMTFFGYGRGASRARKLLVSLWYNMAWGFVQIVVIITMLAIAAHTESKTMPGRSEWVACDRPLGAWACIYVVRIVFSSSLTYWGWLRDRKALSTTDDAENANERSSRHAAPNSATLAHPPPIGTSSTSGAAEGQPALQHSVLYSRLSILSSLFTLSWFLTAHILQYTSIHTCRFSSPHLWWLTFGILCIMYLVVLEVIVLGVIVFLIAPIIFLIWNIFLMCLGRHPLQNPTMIRPDIGKLSPSVVDRIPLVMYIPPPPDAPPGSIKIPEAVYSYPPKPPPSVKPKRRFKFIRRRGSNKDAVSDVPERTPREVGKPQTWEDHWEYTGYPFVMLEGNRAACAICLMDFEEPKRMAEPESTLAPSTTGEAPSSATLVIEEVPAQVGEPALKLEDAGEGAQPLRLLACGHVFHKTCLDPWLVDVSGRCPVCQRAVELPAPHKGK